jgi:hypothetical protein
LTNQTGKTERPALVGVILLIIATSLSFSILKTGKTNLDAYLAMFCMAGVVLLATELLNRIFYKRVFKSKNETETVIYRGWFNTSTKVESFDGKPPRYIDAGLGWYRSYIDPNELVQSPAYKEVVKYLDRVCRYKK